MRSCPGRSVRRNRRPRLAAGPSVTTFVDRYPVKLGGARTGTGTSATTFGRAVVVVVARVVVVGAVDVVVFGTVVVVVVVGAVVVVVGAVVVGAVVVVVGAVVVVVGAVVVVVLVVVDVVVVGCVVVVVLDVVVVGAVVVVVLDVVVVGAVVVVVLDVVVVGCVVVVLEVVVVELVVVVLEVLVVPPTSQWLTVRFDLSVPFVAVAVSSLSPASVCTVNCTDPWFGGWTVTIFTPAFWKVAVSVHGPVSGLVRMNNQFCLPAGTLGSLVVVPLQNPLVAPLPFQMMVAAMATPANTRSAVRTVTTAMPVFVNRRRKRCMTALPFPPRGGFVRSGSLGRAPYQARNACPAMP
jgi:hypothetical protein